MSYTVSQITNEIKTALLKNIPDKLNVEGEISNYKVSNSNMFFTLKDEESAISVVSWGFEKYFDNDFANGDQVKVSGKVSCYGKNGSYSLQVFKIEKQGKGDLHNSYENMKKVYQDKGYFDQDRKTQFPSNLTNIGIITSPEGAAIQDILFVLNKNKFQGKVFIKRCMVQGNSCAKSIAESIEYLNNLKIKGSKKKLDLIMVTRGGGSFEDLMGYSDPKVIQAIYDSDIFVMSAVGHEVDFMLSDFVSDLRAPTPSIGAEIISKKQKENLDRLNDINDFIKNTLKNKIINILASYQNKLDVFKAKNKNPIESLENKIIELNNLEDNLHKFMESIFTNYKLKINAIEKNIEKTNITSSIMIKNSSGDYLPCISIEDFNNLDKKNKVIRLILNDGEVDITIKKIDINSNK
jgi:exodeoxyribonuclease VII large subunit